MGCKRVAYDAGWLASFRRDNVDLVASPIVRITEKGLVTADGQEHELDVIAWATGFEVSDTGVGLNHNVFGENGVELSEIWRKAGGAYGYLGVAVPEVPNFFVPLGPNAAAMSWGFSLGNNVCLLSA
jgi:cation diffusion facilitator CzcD-associated flavoprotein CzcO